MQNIAATVVVLATGGTIAGTAAAASDNIGYTAAQLSVAQLLAALPALVGLVLDSEQVAQIDSKDMDAGVWLALARRAAHHLSRVEVAGVVVTHGTDTLEETAYFLHRVLAPAKPVVLTAAMRPVTGLGADGPQNLLDGVRLAALPGARGVVVAFAGGVHSAVDVRKVHTYRLDAFGSGDAGALAQMEEGRLRQHRPWPADVPFGVDRLPDDPATWPRVELLTSHAGADGRLVEAMVAAGTQGIVVAGTGNGTLHRRLEAALNAAQAAGVKVVRTSRWLDGAVIDAARGGLPSAGTLNPAKARIALMLDLIAAAAPAPATAS